MANVIEKFNAIALADIEKINGKTDDNIEKLNGFEFTGVTQQGLMYAGIAGSTYHSTKNLVSTSGVVATDTDNSTLDKKMLAGAEYGTGLGIFAFGEPASGGMSAGGVSNLVNTSGVIAADVSRVGTGRYLLAAAGYGGDKASFGFGANASATNVSMTNLVSNSGVVASDTTGVGTARQA